MPQRLRSRATAAVAAGLTATCIGVAATPAFADTVRNQEWWLTSLHVTKAWLSSRGAGVKVAVLDTGVDANQPDLAGSVTTGRDYTGSGRTAGGPFWGVHGTAVASIIAGHGHGPHHADGVMGVAPEAKILSVRVTLETKDPLLANSTVAAALPDAIARGIRYALRHGAQVIDLPLDPAAQAGATTPGGSPAERSAVAAALAKGVVLVAPSGDNGAGSDTVNYPAAYPGVISVGAFGQGFIKAPFTNHQAYATLTAAGNGVIAANGPTGYAKLKSTSAASAVVAGIAALIRSQFPTLTPAQVEQALTSSTAFHHPAGQKDGSGAGTADAAAALLAAATINATPTSSASPGSAGNPTPPTAPVVKVSTKSLWQAVRIPVLGLAALVLLALIILISVRVRQRRVLDAQLAPLQAAARASRAQSAAGMTGMGSPGPGYGPPAGAGAGSRAPASSEASGSGAANFGLGGPGLAGRVGQRMAGPDFAGPELAGPGLAGAGLAGAGSAGAGSAGAPSGSGFASGGRPGSGSIGRPVVSGRPPWEEDDLRAPPASAPAPPAPEPARPSARFLLPGRGLGSAGTAGNRPGHAGPGGSAPGNEGPGNGGPAGRVPGSGSPSAGDSAPGREGMSSLNLGGWSLGKPGGGTGRAGGRNGVPDAGNSTAGSSTPGGSTAGGSTPGRQHSGRQHPGRQHSGRQYPGRQYSRQRQPGHQPHGPRKHGCRVPIAGVLRTGIPRAAVRDRRRHRLERGRGRGPGAVRPVAVRGSVVRDPRVQSSPARRLTLRRRRIRRDSGHIHPGHIHPGHIHPRGLHHGFARQPRRRPWAGPPRCGPRRLGHEFRGRRSSRPGRSRLRPRGRSPGPPDADARVREPAQRGAWSQAERAAAVGTSREAGQRAAVDGCAGLRPEPEGSAAARLPGGRGRAGYRCRGRRRGCGRDRHRPSGRQRARRPRTAAHDRIRAGAAPSEQPEPVP